MTPQGWAGARQQFVAPRQAPLDAHTLLSSSLQEAQGASHAAGGGKISHGTLGSKPHHLGGPDAAKAGDPMLSVFRKECRN